MPAPRTLEEIALSLPAGSYRSITFREGTKGTLRGRFARVALWAAHGYTQRQHRGERARERLLIEWPKEAAAPLKYWLLWLEPTLGIDHPAPKLREMALLAKRRFQVEQDYRELKEELGLDHDEGRHWSGWHHHVTLASMAHLFWELSGSGWQGRAEEERKKNLPGQGSEPPDTYALPTLPQVRRRLQAILIRLIGRCPWSTPATSSTTNLHE